MTEARDFSETSDRPAIPGIAAAWRFAMRHAGTGPGFRIGVCDEGDKLVATTMLGSFDQVKTFSRQMEKVGYVALIVGTQAEMQGCDVIFVRRKQTADLLDPE